MHDQERIEERKITWETVDPESLRQLLWDTINETVIQQVSVANSRAQLLQSPRPEHVRLRNDTTQSIIESTEIAVSQLRNIQHLLKQGPKSLVPIDHRYEEGGGNPIIALDMIGDQPK